MAKNLTNFVRSIGIRGGVDRNKGVWEYSNERCHSQACKNSIGQTTVVWCVPPNVSTAKFELWGAGGQAAGTAACCGIAAPASAGAYAWKEISVTPGDCYTVYSGMSWCASPCRCPQDHRIAVWGVTCCEMFNTWVTGTGLTNFCANKGHDSCYITCGDFAAQGVGNIDSADTFLWNDSQNAPQACYYGADGGERGYNGYTFVPRNGNPLTTSEFCSWRMAIPYPAGLITKKPGRTIDFMCCNQSGCVQYSFSDTFDYGSGVMCGGFSAGRGSASAASCGANVNCGWKNNAGKVRITYS